MYTYILTPSHTQNRHRHRHIDLNMDKTVCKYLHIHIHTYMYLHIQQRTCNTHIHKLKIRLKLTIQANLIKLSYISEVLASLSKEKQNFFSKKKISFVFLGALDATVSTAYSHIFIVTAIVVAIAPVSRVLTLSQLGVEIATSHVI